MLRSRRDASYELGHAGPESSSAGPSPTRGGQTIYVLLTGQDERFLAVPTIPKFVRSTQCCPETQRPRIATREGVQHRPFSHCALMTHSLRFTQCLRGRRCHRLCIRSSSEDTAAFLCVSECAQPSGMCQSARCASSGRAPQERTRMDRPTRPTLGYVKARASSSVKPCDIELARGADGLRWA
eukprot:2398067-Pleurochrysis_carterae.AAC.6